MGFSIIYVIIATFEKLFKYLIMETTNFKQFAPNLYISNNPGWGEFREEYIFDLLSSVDINFSKELERNHFQSNSCYIEFANDNPLCLKLTDDLHMIRISANESYYCQWIYQFSHEYCHHLINGAFSGDITGLIWFEEAICELSSMYHLHQTHIDWSISAEGDKSKYAPSFHDYFDSLLAKNQQLVDLTHYPGWLSSWLPFLSEPEYYREHYNAIATRMLPFFIENSHLWKIILHFGDSRKWNSLQDLFEHLFETADGTYSCSLKKLYDMLFY